MFLYFDNGVAAIICVQNNYYLCYKYDCEVLLQTKTCPW